MNECVCVYEGRKQEDLLSYTALWFAMKCLLFVVLMIHIPTCVWYMLACTGMHYNVPCRCSRPYSWAQHMNAIYRTLITHERIQDKIPPPDSRKKFETSVETWCLLPFISTFSVLLQFFSETKNRCLFIHLSGRLSTFSTYLSYGGILS